jgi:hypothetical protein
MPGYNHYSDCTCGWRDKSGFRFDRTRWKSFYDEYQAKSFLVRNGVSRGRAACFVSPNAHCPECGADVFYYQNEFGSRVFFDDLGPPWPKHPCTDRSPPPKEKSKTKPVITPRARGLVQELTAAASAVGLYQGQRIYNGISREWTLIQIQSVARKGFYNFVAARFLATDFPAVAICWHAPFASVCPKLILGYTRHRPKESGLAADGQFAQAFAGKSPFRF